MRLMIAKNKKFTSKTQANSLNIKYNAYEKMYKIKIKIHMPLTNLSLSEKHIPSPKKVETKKNCWTPFWYGTV
jgi:hypothetical protein